MSGAEAWLPPSEPPGRRPWLSWVAAGFLASGFLGLFGLTVWAALLDAGDQREKRSQDIARLSEISITRTLESVQGALIALGEEARSSLEERNAADGGPDLAWVKRRIASTLRFAPHIRQVAILQDGGTLIDSRGGTEAIALAALDLPRSVGRGLGGGLRIGRVVPGRFLPRLTDPPATGPVYRSILPVALSIEGGDRSGELTVLMALNPAYFESILAETVIGAHGEAALTRFDGTVLLRASGPDGGVLEDRHPDLRPQVDDGIDSGLLRLSGPDEWFLGAQAAYRLSERYPLAVMVGVSHRDTLFQWLSSNRDFMIWGGATLLALVFIGGLFAREVVRRLRLQGGIRLLSRAVEQSETPVMITDPEGLLVHVNPAFTDQTGWPAEAVIGLTPSFLKSGRTPPETYEQMWATLKAGRAWSGEFINRHRDGQLIWDLSTISPVRDTNGTVTHLIATKLDITAQKAAENEREKLIVALNRANAELKRFSEVSAHHLQEPVRRLVSFSQMLRGHQNTPPPPERASFFVEEIEKGASHLHRLISEIQLYLAAGEPRSDTPASDARGVIRRVIEHHRPAFDQVGATVILPDTLPGVGLDGPRLRDVVEQVLGNALTYRRPEVALRVSISAETTEDMVTLRITDNGRGIPEPYRDRAFRVFERVSADSCRDGTGIGLAYVRRIAESVDGAAWLEDGEDGGITVAVSLPAYQDGDG